MTLIRFLNEKYENKLSINKYGAFIFSKKFIDQIDNNYKFMTICIDYDEKILVFQFSKEIQRGSIPYKRNIYGYFRYGSASLLRKLCIDFKGKKSKSFIIENHGKSTEPENYSDSYFINYGDSDDR